MFKQPFRRVIQIELNEVSAALVDQLVHGGQLPMFRRLRDWDRLDTTSEVDYQLIEPWIQWVSAHTGKTFAEHRVFSLGEQYHLSTPQIWETLSAHGLVCCVISPMNSRRGALECGVFVPDPWATRDETFPRTLAPLWQLLSKKVKGHATAGKISVSDFLAGLLVCVRMRLPMALYLRLAVGAIRALSRRTKRWRLAALLDDLLTEVFISGTKSTSPAYASVFLNSVAHYQHHFWRNYERAGFNHSIASPDCALQDDPVTFGYQQLDQRLARIVSEFDDGQTIFIVASGLSQEPFHEHEEVGGMNYYRLTDHAAFMTKLGIESVEVFPLMSRDWRIASVSAQRLQETLSALSGISVNGQQLFTCTASAEREILIETRVTALIEADAEVLTGAGASLGRFGDWFANTAVKSGHHTGIGTVWFSQALDGECFGADAQARALPVTALYDIACEVLMRRNLVGEVSVDATAHDPALDARSTTMQV